MGKYLEDKMRRQIGRLAKEGGWKLEAPPMAKVAAHCVHCSLGNTGAAEEPHLGGRVHDGVAHRGRQGGEGVQG